MNDALETEWELIENSKTNSQSFEALYKKYYEQILRFAYKRLDKVEDAYEITADTFAKALSSIHKYEHRGLKFSSWLYRIAMNEVNQFYRNANKKRTICIDSTSAKYIAEETGRDRLELNAALKLALQYLTTDEIQLLELRFFEERPFSEVAEILGITENNAKVKTYRVIDKLRIHFNKVS